MLWRPAQRGGPRPDQPAASGAVRGGSTSRGRRTPAARRVTPALWPCRKANFSKHPARTVEHRGQHQPNRQRRRHRPPAAVAEDPGQAAGMSGREQALEKLLRDVDPHQTSAHSSHSAGNESVKRDAEELPPNARRARAGTRPPRPRSAPRSTAQPSADTSAPALELAWRGCRTPANSEAGARRTRPRASTPTAPDVLPPRGGARCRHVHGDDTGQWLAAALATRQSQVPRGKV